MSGGQGGPDASSYAHVCVGGDAAIRDRWDSVARDGKPINIAKHHQFSRLFCENDQCTLETKFTQAMIEFMI
jgi:hypothetical protein